MKVISWEYKVSVIKNEKSTATQMEAGLNFYGKAGWEFAAIIDVFEDDEIKKAVVLKRPVALTKVEDVYLNH